MYGSRTKAELKRRLVATPREQTDGVAASLVHGWMDGRTDGRGLGVGVVLHWPQSIVKLKTPKKPQNKTWCLRAGKGEKESARAART